ncbi:hypothetical protein YenMTG1_115 [Yersinia phage vB_YenM_TG1]|uniref:DUF7202 domain-containing protein n=1 Tax=Yersinia phage vB_YenM_TG1 TaxID=1589265 RepID=A0A0B5A2Q9_9CAUD|nr:hypothetical protein AVV33_gp115 [Yersinia phage vB_YenM_TG1]AJD81925.1 hypothetical protein YenMTG1_115 [Yersinia phage vB_YenM_TG1]
MTHYPHPFVPKHKSEIHRQWKEIREAKCPIVGAKTSTYTYEGTFIEYTYINKKGKFMSLSFAYWLNGYE